MPAGRPRIFKSPEEMKERIEKYFDYCDNRIKSVFIEKLGEHMQVSDPEPYTMAGLAYYLGMSRQTLIDYTERDEFLDTIKKARQRVEFDIERRMVDKNTFTPGLIFSAKNNFGWKDKTETDIMSGGEKLEALVVIKDK